MLSYTLSWVISSSSLYFGDQSLCFGLFPNSVYWECIFLLYTMVKKPILFFQAGYASNSFVPNGMKVFLYRVLSRLLTENLSSSSLLREAKTFLYCVLSNYLLLCRECIKLFSTGRKKAFSVSIVCSVILYDYAGSIPSSLLNGSKPLSIVCSPNWEWIKWFWSKRRKDYLQRVISISSNWEPSVLIEKLLY